MHSRAWIAVAAVIVLRLLFLNQAIQGDDPYYLAGAMHALIDPAHPSHARLAFQGDLITLQGHPHPPLNIWVLSLLIAVFKDVYEVRFHGAYIAFAVIAVLAMHSLSKRFAPRPLLATLLLLGVPAFVINGTSLETDLPFLAWWLAAVALFIRAVDVNSRRLLAGAVITAALAAMTAYQAVVLTPILALYLWLHGRKDRRYWLALLAAPLTVLAWQSYERLTSGTLPAAVLTGYFQTYGLQRWQNKLRSGIALTAHLAWIASPALIWLAFRPRRQWLWGLLAGIAFGAAFLDPHPLFWASFTTGVLIVAACVYIAREPDPDRRFLAGWLLLFFAASLVLFFAGSARYLLPLAAPLLLLVARQLHDRPRWLLAGLGANLALALMLTAVNYWHWLGYQQIAAQLGPETSTRRVWVNSEWGLRWYLESQGALPVLKGQRIQPGDVVVTSELGYPVPLSTGGLVAVPILRAEVRPRLPLRLFGLHSRSGYSTVAAGLRPFDIVNAPADVVTAVRMAAANATLSYVAANDPAAERHLVTGVYQLEDNQWRWMSPQASVLVLRPAAPRPVSLDIFLPEVSPAREVRILADGTEVLRQRLQPGRNVLTTPPVQAGLLRIEADKGFQPPGDNRNLALILNGVGYQQ